MDYKQVIIAYMSRQNINQDEFALRCGVSSATISRWLRAKHGITRKNMEKISFITGRYEAESIADEPLEQVVAAWPSLPAKIRQSIAVLISPYKKD